MDPQEYRAKKDGLANSSSMMQGQKQFMQFNTY